MFAPEQCFHRKEFMKNANPFVKAIAIIGLVIGGLIIAAGLAFLFAIFIKLLWNWLMPSIFGLREINFWEAFGLTLLAHLLFGFGGRGGGHKNKSPRKPFPKEFIHDEMKNFRDYWREEGKEAFEHYCNERKEPPETPPSE